MRCVIPKAHLKIFARAVHSLAKIGDDLYLDAGEGGLAISTINSSRSAYATYSFRAAFFSSYEPPAEDVNTTDANEDDDDDDAAGERSKCKVAMKGAVWVFKSISHLEKTVDSAELTLAPLESKLRARMNCRFSVSKTYSLPFLECEPLKANYDASHSKNGFTAQSKVLSEAALNFLSNQEEVTLLAESDAFVIKNYIDVYDVRNADKEQPTPTGGIKGAPVHTKLSMNPETDFSRYEIDPADEEQSKAGLTFCLKEFRSILAFADALNLPISASFDSGGLYVLSLIIPPQRSLSSRLSPLPFQANNIFAQLPAILRGLPRHGHHVRRQLRKQQPDGEGPRRVGGRGELDAETANVCGGGCRGGQGATEQGPDSPEILGLC